LYPAQNRCVRQRSFRHHLDQVPRAQFVSEVPAHAKHNDFPVEMPPLEQIQRSHPGPLSPSIPSPQSLHQNQIAYLRARHVVLIRIKDPGEGFSLQENLDTAANNPPDDPMRHLKHRETQGIRPGGYGILLAKNLVDELFYGEKGNDVLLIKYINDERRWSASPPL